MNEIQSTELNQIEVEINFYKGQAVQSIFEIGERLIKAKELVEHGEWEDWLESKVDFSIRQAQRFIQVRQEFRNTTSVSHLGQTKIFALLSVPKEEREEFIENNPVEDMTTRELRQAIKEKKELEKEVEAYKHQQDLLREENEGLKNRGPQVIEKEVEVEPEDYDYYKHTTRKLQDEVSKLKRNLTDRDNKLEELEGQRDILERKAKLNEEESTRFNQLKSQIENLTRQKSDIGRQIKAKTELSGLVVRIEHILKTELAPVKYSRSLREVRDDKIVMNNLEEIVESVQSWCDEMYSILSQEKIIDAEVINNE